MSYFSETIFNVNHFPSKELVNKRNEISDIMSASIINDNLLLSLKNGNRIKVSLNDFIDVDEPSVIFGQTIGKLASYVWEKSSTFKDDKGNELKSFTCFYAKEENKETKEIMPSVTFYNAEFEFSKKQEEKSGKK